MRIVMVVRQGVCGKRYTLHDRRLRIIIEFSRSPTSFVELGEKELMSWYRLQDSHADVPML